MRLKQSMYYAWQGIRCAWREERQMKIHLVMAVVSVLCGVVADLSGVEWAILTIAIMSVIAMEMVNTAIERVVDLVTEDYHPLAKAAKDIAAGAVLVVSLGAVMIGVCLFGTRVIEWIGG